MELVGRVVSLLPVEEYKLAGFFLIEMAMHVFDLKVKDKNIEDFQFNICFQGRGALKPPFSKI